MYTEMNEEISSQVSAPLIKTLKKKFKFVEIEGQEDDDY